MGAFSCSNFVTIAPSRIARTRELNLLTGRNAQGKTNLLEALAVLLTGRSFRTTRLAELPRWDAEAAVLSGELQRSEGTRTVRRTIQQHEDGAWQVSGEGCPWARVIVFGWQDLAILNGGPAARRNFIDGFAARLYPGHLPALLRYRRLVEQRNRLLQSRGHGRPPGAVGRAARGRRHGADRSSPAGGGRAADRARRGSTRALGGDAQKVEIGYRSVAR